MMHRAWDATQGGATAGGQFEQFVSANESEFDFQSPAVTPGSATPQRHTHRLISLAIWQLSSVLQPTEPYLSKACDRKAS